MHGLSVHSSGRCCPQMPSLCCQASYFGPGRVRTHAVSPRNQAGSGCDNLQSTARLFQQHKLLLGAGFSYDQASLILQVSQQRKAAATQAVTVQGGRREAGVKVAALTEAGAFFRPNQATVCSLRSILDNTHIPTVQKKRFGICMHGYVSVGLPVAKPAAKLARHQAHCIGLS